MSWVVHGDPEPLCPECDGDGYVEWLTDDLMLMTAPCPSCFPELVDSDLN